MEVRGEFHIRVLYCTEWIPLPAEQKAGWAPDTVLTIWRKETSLSATWVQTPMSLASQHIDYAFRITYVLLNICSSPCYNKLLNTRILVDANSKYFTSAIYIQSTDPSWRDINIAIISKWSFSICCGENLRLPWVKWSVERSKYVNKTVKNSWLLDFIK